MYRRSFWKIRDRRAATGLRHHSLHAPGPSAVMGRDMLALWARSAPLSKRDGRTRAVFSFAGQPRELSRNGARRQALAGRAGFRSICRPHVEAPSGVPPSLKTLPRRVGPERRRKPSHAQDQPEQDPPPTVYPQNSAFQRNFTVNEELIGRSPAGHGTLSST